jgi:hypothetical protein
MEPADVAARSHEVERAERARAVLDNPLFGEAFEAVEQDLITQWKQNANLGPDGREKAFLMVTLLGQVKQVLTQHIQTGEMASLQLKEHRTLKERIGRRFGTS